LISTPDTCPLRASPSSELTVTCAGPRDWSGEGRAEPQALGSLKDIFNTIITGVSSDVGPLRRW
jgi:hypothetical protein